MRVDVEIVFFQNKLLGTERPTFKVENTLRIEALAHIAGLEMEMGTSGASRRATITNQLTCLDDIAALNEAF